MLTELEDKIVDLVKNLNQEEFIFEFLRLYDIPKQTISKLKAGTNNLSKVPGEVHLKNKLFFKPTTENIFSTFVKVDEFISELSSQPRYLFVTDFKTVLAKDTKTGDTLDIPLGKLHQNFDFFLAWNNMEKVDFTKENPADIKAAERFARIYDELIKVNQNAKSSVFNIFLIRLLFCLFAEDTGIFPQDKMFTNDIKTLSNVDGSDLNQLIKEIFGVLDERVKSDNVPGYLLKYPYVNGHLFSQPHEDLIFNQKIRRLIIEAGELLNWSQVNPDILGSMVQAVATDSTRSTLGMHYTSVSNIMKVLNPLFLDNLKSEFYSILHQDIKDETKLKKFELLMNRIRKIKFFDPACGSGNFLIIAYKEMRRLEMNIYQQIVLLNRKTKNITGMFYVPVIQLNQFYGIEIDDFAHHVAMLSLWIADHQMNIELHENFPEAVRATLPLQKVGAIRCGNALAISWNEVCPSNADDEVYIFGNPPYLGSRNQENIHKRDMARVFGNIKGYKKLDYISAWFLEGARYILNNQNAEYAFVTTNSVFQGEQVSILWNEIFKHNIEITFAYTSFKWTNHAKNSATVTVAIAGLSQKGKRNKKVIYNGLQSRSVSNISAYLAEGASFFVKSSTKSLFNLSKMQKGNAAYDDGQLTFSVEEYEDYTLKFPESKEFFRKYVSADDVISGVYKYCLWIDESNLDKALSIPFIRERIDNVRKYRLASKREVTIKQAEKPYAFGEIRYQSKMSIIIPVVSSETRRYIPIAIIDPEIIPSYSTFVLYDFQIWELGFLLSRMHMIWLRALGGKLETRYRYSAGLVYNTFPIPKLNQTTKDKLEAAVLEILDIRDEEGGTLSELYGSPLAENNPRPMNSRLQAAHETLDALIEGAYQKKAFANDEERLGLLLTMYQERMGK